MVARAHGAQLRTGKVVELSGQGQVPRGPDAEGDRLPDLVHEGGDSRPYVVGLQVDTQALLPQPMS